MTDILVKGSPLRFWVLQILIALLVFPPAAEAQTPAPAPAQATPATPLATQQNLRILTLAGNGEYNDVQRLIMSPLVVQVLDQDGRPIEGAQVIFSFPLQGPSATFPNHQSSQTTRTNADGQAAATGWVANGLGTFKVQVTASRAAETGETTVTMTNATRIPEDAKRAKHKGFFSSKWAKVVIIAGAAAVTVAIILVTRGGSSTTTVTAVPGSPTIGAPQ